MPLPRISAGLRAAEGPQQRLQPLSSSAAGPRADSAEPRATGCIATCRRGAVGGLGQEGVRYLTQRSFHKYLNPPSYGLPAVARHLRS
ncbi:MAG: hypothetical protein WKG07_10490 [Hymenobacter sp.]